MFVDFDGDDMLGTEDLEEIIHRLLGDEKLSSEDIIQLVQNLILEADLDDDSMLSYAEFEHIVAKSTDFVQYVGDFHLNKNISQFFMQN